MLQWVEIFKAKKVSYKTFFAETGVPFANLYNWESRKYWPRLDKAFEFQAAFNAYFNLSLSLEEMWFDEENL